MYTYPNTYLTLDSPVPLIGKTLFVTSVKQTERKKERMKERKKERKGEN